MTKTGAIKRAIIRALKFIYSLFLNFQIDFLILLEIYIQQIFPFMSMLAGSFTFSLRKRFRDEVSYFEFTKEIKMLLLNQQNYFHDIFFKLVILPQIIF